MKRLSMILATSLLALSAAAATTINIPLTVTVTPTQVTIASASSSTTIPVPSTPVTPPIVTPPPVTGTIWEYDGTGKNLWPQDYSWGNAVPTYNDTSGGPVGTPYDIKVTINQAWGGWQPSLNNGQTIQVVSGYMEFDIKPTQPGQVWKLIAHKSDDESNVGPTLDLADFCPAPKVGVWAHCKIAAKTLMGNLTGLWKFGIQDGTGHTNVWYVNKVVFTP